tara:strand:+ start:189 stop:893 length:705 start_codon:yes stop_codon:yes gene_type:complete
MKILVNGCSFSRGPISWPYYLSGLTDVTGQNVINLACAGAGNTYIHDTTTRILYDQPFDLVLIMWTGMTRVDMQVENIDQFGSTTYTSNYQKNHNDWPKKIISPVNDQSFVEDDWLFGCGALNHDAELTKVFKSIYQYTSQSQFVNKFMINVVSLQNTLKQLKIPYAFSFYTDYVKEIAHSKMIDWKNCVLSDNIDNVAKRLNSYDTDGSHPGLQANKEWAKCVMEHLRTRDIV